MLPAAWPRADARRVLLPIRRGPVVVRRASERVVVESGAQLAGRARALGVSTAQARSGEPRRLGTVAGRSLSKPMWKYDAQAVSAPAAGVGRPTSRRWRRTRR